MGSLMDLVAGDARDIVLLPSPSTTWRRSTTRTASSRTSRSAAVSTRPGWDLFAEAVRSVTGSEDPTDFLDARVELEGAAPSVERIVDRVDPEWIETVAQVPDDHLGPLAGRWIELLEEELGLLPREEKPWIRDLAGRIVTFCRAAAGARDVVFAWPF